MQHSQQSKQARCVFVGNIPYDATEEQLIEVFQEVGPVVNFRLVFDRDTGKPKGYGFCEYRDAETALSAMRNLNNYDFNGRQLRVDFAETDKGGATGGTTRTQPTKQQSSTTHNIPNFSNAASNPESINSLLEALPASTLYDILSKMQTAIQQNPEQIKQLLVETPTFAYALLQAMVILGLVSPQTVQKVMTKVQQPTVPIAPVIQPPVAPMTIPQIHPQLIPGPFAAYGAAMKPQPFVQAAPGGVSLPYAPAAINELPSVIGGRGVPVDQLGDQQKLLLLQLMNLSPQDIEALPPEHKQMVQQLRQTVLQQNIRL